MENIQFAQKKNVNKRYKLKVSQEDSILFKRSKATKVLFGFIFALFCLYALSLIAPFVFLFFNSLKTSSEYTTDLANGQSMALPDQWLFQNYVDAFKSMKLTRVGKTPVGLLGLFFNSIWYSLVCSLSGVFASALTAYCLAKYRFKLRGFFYGIAIFSMTIPILGSTGATYKLLYALELYNTPFLPVLLNFSGFGFNFLILYGFFSNIPWSYAEAVFMDGGGHGTVFFKIMLPQAWPAMLTLIIMSFITAWNDYLTVLLYMPHYPTLASGLHLLESSRELQRNKPMYFAGLMLSLVPIVVLFSAFSNTIMQNFTVGGLKG